MLIIWRKPGISQLAFSLPQYSATLILTKLQYNTVSHSNQPKMMNNTSYLIKYQCFNISKKKWPRVYKTSVYFNSFDLCYNIIIDKRNVIGFLILKIRFRYRNYIKNVYSAWRINVTSFLETTVDNYLGYYVLFHLLLISW